MYSIIPAAAPPWTSQEKHPTVLESICIKDNNKEPVGAAGKDGD